VRYYLLGSVLYGSCLYDGTDRGKEGYVSIECVVT